VTSRCANDLVIPILPIHNQQPVVGYVEQRPVAILEALAGLTVPMPDDAEADVPGFVPSAFRAVRLVRDEIRETTLKAEAATDRDERLGAKDAVGIVVHAGVETSFAAVAAVQAVEQHVLIAGLKSVFAALAIVAAVAVEADGRAEANFVAAAANDAELAADLVEVCRAGPLIDQSIPNNAEVETFLLTVEHASSHERLVEAVLDSGFVAVQLALRGTVAELIA